jgi:heme/copper-type cytochrome/quinol oxidase subunit 2
MRLIVLEICGGIALLVFVVMLAAIARHRLQGRSQTYQGNALAEYLWATIPWLMIISSAIPAARQIVASAREPFAAAPVAGVLGPASHAWLSKAAVVIDEQERKQR